jgi:membrane protease YdiL (CAAX protease family)
MRAFAAFVAVIVLAGVIAATLAYPAFELTSTFASWPFHRVASRIALAVLIVELVWLCRRLGLTRREAFGYGLERRRFVRVALAAGLAGIGTAAIGAAFLLGAHLRIADPSFPMTATALALAVLTALASGVAVALLEETVFRGAMHTAIARESGTLAAVLCTAPLFALLHFFARVHIPAAEVRWSSGFYLLAHSFAPLANPALVMDAFLSWLAVGLVLSLTRVLTGNIAVALGLHAGWVMVLRLLQLTTVTGPGFADSPWVSRMDGLLGYWLLPWALAIAAGLWLGRDSIR